MSNRRLFYYIGFKMFFFLFKFSSKYLIIRRFPRILFVTIYEWLEIKLRSKLLDKV